MVSNLTIPTKTKNLIKILAAKQHRSIKDLIIEAINDILKKYGELV